MYFHRYNVVAMATHSILLYKFLSQRFLGKAKKYHGVVITIKNIIIKILDNLATALLSHIVLKDDTN